MNIEEKIKETSEALAKVNKAVADNKEQAKKLKKTLAELIKLLKKADEIVKG